MTLTLIILINTVLSVLIVAAIAALQTGAILTDRRRRSLPAAGPARHSESAPLIPQVPGDRWPPARAEAARRHEPIAA